LSIHQLSNGKKDDFFSPLLVFQKVAGIIFKSGFSFMATFWSPTTKLRASLYLGFKSFE